MPAMWLPKTVLALLLWWVALATGAGAHPHIFIAVQTTVLYDNGAFVGVRHKWTFDEFYTTMAIEGLDKNNDGVYDREELAELAKVNVEGLKEFGYFTVPALAGTEVKVGEARDYWLEYKDGALSLLFTVPFATQVLAEAKGFTISIFDATYYIAFNFAQADPVKLSEGAPRGCEAKLATAAETAGERSALEALQGQIGAYAAGIAKTIVVSCTPPPPPGPVAAAPPPPIGPVASAPQPAGPAAATPPPAASSPPPPLAAPAEAPTGDARIAQAPQSRRPAGGSVSQTAQRDGAARQPTAMRQANRQSSRQANRGTANRKAAATSRRYLKTASRPRRQDACIFSW